ncbi:hypothetical protein [Candidatus Tisiphia endosymbiont of Beris chalybata]|uniref:hypothetical protein n=1 Tax=Candidatus Tisiphia endosymbiont of Beris chalybata TaxID=3066262 RepID=UPI00312CAD10
MEILKDYYNSKQPINSQDVAKLKSLINHERFNANMSIICQYKTPLPTLNEYEENSSKYDNNTIVQIVQNDEKKHAGKGACFIKKRAYRGAVSNCKHTRWNNRISKLYTSNSELHFT